MWILIPTFLLATLFWQGVELLFGLLISGDVQVVGGLLEHTLKNEVGGGVRGWSNNCDASVNQSPGNWRTINRWRRVIPSTPEPNSIR